MEHRGRYFTGFLTLLALLCLLAAPLAALAQETEGEGEMQGPPIPEALPDAEETPAPPAASPAELLYHPREGFSLKYLEFTLGIHALVQLDLMVYEPEDYDPSAGSNHRSNSLLLRRAFVGLTGKAGSWLDWKVEYDIPNYSMRDTYGEISPGDSSITLRAGYFKPAVTWEEFRNPDESLTFNEQAAHVWSMFPGRRLGVMVGMEVPSSKGAPPLLRGWAGVHNGTEGWGANDDNNWGVSTMVEVNIEPADGLLLQAGTSHWVSYVRRGNAWEGMTPDGLTNNFFQNYATGGLEQIHAAHANFYFGRFAVMFEYTHGIQQRKIPWLAWENLAPVVGQGFHLDASVMLWSPDGKPRREPRFNKGLEFCARVERFALNDARRGSARRSLVSTMFDADNLLGGRMCAVTLGCNWHITERVRLSGSMQTQWFDLESQRELRLIWDEDNRPRRGGPRFVWLFRLQVMI